MIVFHARLHVLELVQDRKHVDEFSESEQVGLAHKFFLFLWVTKTPHFGAERIYCFALILFWLKKNQILLANESDNLVRIKQC